MVRGFIRSAIAALIAATAVCGKADADPLQFKNLTLTDGWVRYDTTVGKPSAAVDPDNIVHLRGALHQATALGDTPFVLPTQFRPDTDVYVPVTLVKGTAGRLTIHPDGNVSVQAAGDFGDAQAFTSLESVTYPKATDPLPFTNLHLMNGWVRYSSEVGKPAAAIDSDNIVHLKGALAAGTSAYLFVVPAKFRPNRLVYVPVDMVDGKIGRLIIAPDGTVQVQAGSGNFSDAQSFTSLEGVTYSKTAAPLEYTNLPLIHHWASYSVSTAKPAAAVDSKNVVHLKGAMHETSGSSDAPFVLPVQFRPNRDVYVPLDLLLGRIGRLRIQPDGVVHVLAADDFSNAQNFTSLEGMSYSIN